MKAILMGLWFSAISLSSAFAQGSGGAHIGNGGEGAEAEFSAITGEILTWIRKNDENGTLTEKLELGSLRLNQSVLIHELSRMMTPKASPVTIRILEKEILVGGVPRTCANYPGIHAIQCQTSKWESTPGPLKYAIVFHEYLGLLGYESNLGDYSQYPISKHLISYVYSTKKYELGLEKVDSVDSSKEAELGRGKVLYERTLDFVTFYNRYCDSLRTKKDQKKCRKILEKSHLPYSITLEVQFLGNESFLKDGKCPIRPLGDLFRQYWSEFAFLRKGVELAAWSQRGGACPTQKQEFRFEGGTDVRTLSIRIRGFQSRYSDTEDPGHIQVTQIIYESIPPAYKDSPQKFFERVFWAWGL